MPDKKAPHWYVEQKKFVNQFAARTYANSIKKPLSFYFFEDFFDRINWSEEPKESWSTLLLHRALQVRESFRYIRFWYSGGADSHTILLTFLRHDIPIDEIVLVRASPSSEFDDYGNSEINRVALPFLNSVRPQIEKTKVTILDIGAEDYRSIYCRDDWMRKFNYLLFRPTLLPAINEVRPELFSDFHLSGQLCDLQGQEKPRLRRSPEGEFFSYFWDSLPGSHIGVNTLEPFFISPDMPELHVKQCHLVKNHLKPLIPPGAENLEEYYDFRSPLCANIDLGCRYPLFINWSLGKSKDSFSLKALAALTQAQKKNSKVFDAYYATLKNEALVNPERFNQKDIFKGPKAVKTKEYSLGF